ncbi:MAG: transketolase C-terminal domain-containing protein [Myxococcota bacterium]
MSEPTVLSHLAHVVVALLRDDPSCVLLGEDVADGGMLGLSRGAIEDAALRPRVLATPLTPSVLAAHAAGLAVSGRHPLVLLPDVAALVEGLAGLREAAAWSWRSEDAVRVPLCFVAPCGPGLGLGGHASEAAISMLTHIPGLTVLCVGRSADAGAWLRAAARHAIDLGPTVLLVPRGLLLGSLDAPMSDELPRHPSAAHRVHDGAAATVFAWGEALPVALAAVERSGIDAAVVDVGCLAPLDLPTLDGEARATGKLVIVHAGPRAGGVGAELAARFADSAILHLDAPVVRVTGAEPPLRPSDEAAAVPDVDRVVQVLTRVANY